MSGDLCSGGGKAWASPANVSALCCPVCGTTKTRMLPDSQTSRFPVPPHAVGSDGSVWVLAVAPRPPEPDPWAVALFETLYKLPWSREDLEPGQVMWDAWHRAAAEARRLAAADRTIRADHWREAAEWASTTNLRDTIFAAADRIEEGEQP